jgi:hypothetical protein
MAMPLEELVDVIKPLADEETHFGLARARVGNTVDFAVGG